jgi:hypothetical protein
MTLVVVLALILISIRIVISGLCSLLYILVLIRVWRISRPKTTNMYQLEFRSQSILSYFLFMYTPRTLEG